MNASGNHSFVLGPILDRIKDLVYVLRVEGQGAYRCVAVNQAGLDALDHSREEVVGHRVEGFLPAGTLSSLREQCEEALTTGAPTSRERELESPAGRRVLAVELRPVRDAGGTTFLLGIGRDVTAQRDA